MSAKKVILYVLILVATMVAVVGGLAVRKYCHRFPTEAEMSDYHASHFPTKLVKLESKVFTKKADGIEYILFKGLHKPGGVDEPYYVEAGRRWVMPWQDYNWKSEEKE